MRGEGRDGQSGDDEEARAGSFTHIEAEEEQIHRNEEEPAPVRKKAGEEPYTRGGADQERTIFPPGNAGQPLRLFDRPKDTHPNEHENDAGREKQGDSANHP